MTDIAGFHFTGTFESDDLTLLQFEDPLTGSFSLPNWLTEQEIAEALHQRRREYLKQQTGQCPDCRDTQIPCKCVSDEALTINQEK